MCGVRLGMRQDMVRFKMRHCKLVPCVSQKSTVTWLKTISETEKNVNIDCMKNTILFRIVAKTGGLGSY